ncbi:VOC family protein [Candidatus Beckwithbacteria bacterium]|nr:VOC family protein [Candidatus Beckwithbacteria bacterium]
MKFLPLLPELYISSLKKSLEFYVDIIGFKIEYSREHPNFAFLSYQGSQLMIQELVPGEKEKENLDYPFGRGINFQIDTESVNPIMKSLKQHEYPLIRGIKDSWYQAGKVVYGCREILVNDPDGYLLRFSESLGKKKIK